MNNLIVCFPGGGGGHLIGAMCSFLLYNKKFNVEANGSVHGFECVKYLDNRFLTHSAESIVQEYADISRLPDFDIAIAHFRDLAHLQRIGKRVIYVNASESDSDVIAKRLSIKMSTMMDKTTYDLLKGSDWPGYDEESNIDELDDVRKLRTDFIKNWFYTIPINQHNIHRINFNQLGSTVWVRELANFLNINEYDMDFVANIIDEYTGKQV